MVDERFIAEWVVRLRDEVPHAVAIILKGSYAQGAAGPFSDLDFDVLIEGRPVDPYLTYFAPRNERLIHVSVAVCEWREWLADASEPADWAFGLPACEATRLLWAATDDLRARLDRSTPCHPAGESELEDFVEAFNKMKNARLAGDELALRLAAQTLGALCPSVLCLVNTPAPVGTRRDALRAALALPVTPAGYRDDLLACLGLSGQATTGETIYRAARRLVIGVVTLLQLHAEAVSGTLPPELPDALRSGNLLQYVLQDADNDAAEDA